MTSSSVCLLKHDSHESAHLPRVSTCFQAQWDLKELVLQSSVDFHWVVFLDVSIFRLLSQAIAPLHSFRFWVSQILCLTPLIAFLVKLLAQNRLINSKLLSPQLKPELRLFLVKIFWEEMFVLFCPLFASEQHSQFEPCLRISTGQTPCLVNCRVVPRLWADLDSQ